MIALLRTLMVFILVFGAVFFILYQMLSFFMGTKSVRRQFQKDVAFLTRLISEFKEGLIPFEEEEFKLLSAQPVVKSSRKSGSVYSKGVLSTIFQEPLIAFSLKHNNRDNNIIMLAETNYKKYKLIHTSEGTEAHVDGDLIGKINLQSQFLPIGANQTYAEILKSDGDKYAKVMINHKDTAHINISDQIESSETERVFSLFHDFKHEDSDEMILLTLYYLFIDSKAA